MKKVIFAALFVMATVAQAGSRDALESSAVVQGTIVLAKDGSVQTAVVDDPAKYGQPIADLVRNAALKWRFQPVLRDGQPVIARSFMHVRVVLSKNSDGNYTARIRGATFDDGDKHSTDSLQLTKDDKKIQPEYPKAAIRGRVQGTVYLSLHVDHDGHVSEAVAEQVNLENIGPDRVMKEYREVLAEAAVKAARRWTYVIPTTGKLAAQDSWTAHVPVNFSMQDLGKVATESVWQTYVPGPYTAAPWVDRPDTNAADAMADDAPLQTEGAGPTLIGSLHHS